MITRESTGESLELEEQPNVKTGIASCLCELTFAGTWWLVGRVVMCMTMSLKRKCSDGTVK